MAVTSYAEHKNTTEQTVISMDPNNAMIVLATTISKMIRLGLHNLLMRLRKCEGGSIERARTEWRFRL